MRVSYCFYAQKRVGSEVVALVNGELLVTEPARGRVTYELSPLCHGDESDAITPRVALRGQEIELEAHSPAGAAQPYRVTVHAAQGDVHNTVEVWVTPAGEQELMLRFYIDWIGERTVRFETSGLWFLMVTIPPADDRG